MIRDATRDDLPAIVAIYNASIPGRMSTAELQPVTVEARVAWFEAHSPDRHPIWVLEEDGVVKAWLGVHRYHERAAYASTVEASVYVAPDAQGRGLGRTLLRAFLPRAASFGIKTMLAFIFAHNEASLRLFEREGFTRWGLLTGVAELDGIERDVVILGLRVLAAGGGGN